MRWYKDGKLLTASKTVRVESKGKTRQLVIDSVDKKDAGEYSCEVGAEKLLFKLHVAGNKQNTCIFMKIYGKKKGEWGENSRAIQADSESFVQTHRSSLHSRTRTLFRKR